MLVIRKSQIEAFEKIAARRFEEGLLAHFRAFFPQHAAALGEVQFQRVIRHGLQRAESRGLVTERAIFLYMALMFLLGSRFDEDPQLPWAFWKVEPAEAVAPQPESAPTPAPAATEATGEGGSDQVDAAPPETADARIERLYAQAMTFLDRTVGPDNQFLQHTLGVLRQPQVFDDLPAAPSFGHRLLLVLQMLGPKKYQALGEETLRQLVRHGYENAKRWGLGTERGIINYVALAFVLGSGFNRDPLYPWAAAILSDPVQADPAQKGTALREAALRYLAQCLPGCPHRAAQSAAALSQALRPYRRIIEEPPTPIPAPVTPTLPDRAGG